MSQLLPIADTQAIIANATTALPSLRTPLAAAQHRVLREDILADTDQPAFDCSSMDGYAIAKGSSGHSTFQVIHEIQPGDDTECSLPSGGCARIYTGARIPLNTERVVMQEDVHVEGGSIHIQSLSEKKHIRYRGESAQKGDVLLKSPLRLKAAELAVLASAGATSPLTSPSPRVVHFATGNELVSPSEQPRPNQIRDSNSTLLAALLSEHSATLIHQSRLKDHFETSLATLQQIPEESFDILLLSGGASVGSYDFGKPLLEKLGFKILVQKIDLRPGKPLIFGKRDRQIAFVIPGNPVSHFVIYHHFIRLALNRLEGIEAPLPTVSATVEETFPYSPDFRVTFWPARVTSVGGNLLLNLIPWKNSGDLKALATVNGLAKFHATQNEIPKGTQVDVTLLDLPYQQ